MVVHSGSSMADNYVQNMQQAFLDAQVQVVDAAVDVGIALDRHEKCIESYDIDEFVQGIDRTNAQGSRRSILLQKASDPQVIVTGKEKEKIDEINKGTWAFTAKAKDVL